MRSKPACIALLNCLLLAGCGDSLEDGLKQRIAEKHEKDLCFTAHRGAFPFGANEKDRDTPWINALAAGGLLSRTEGQPPRSNFERSARGMRYLYDLTPKGKAAIKPGGQFCYGRTVVVALVGHTEPAPRNGVQSLTAEARLRHDLTETWARHPDLLAAGKTKVGEETIKAVFVKDGKAGWVLAF